MSLPEILSSLLPAIRRRTSTASEIDEELRFHLDMRTRENIRAGMPANDARQDAAERFGDIAHIASACEKIDKQYSRALKALKFSLWTLAGAGIWLRMITSVDEVKHAGDVLVVIAVLLQLLIHVRAVRPTTAATPRHTARS
jgi:hypothetical protein